MMNNQIKKLRFLNSKLNKLLMAGLLITVPVFTTLEVKADMYEESQDSEVYHNNMEEGENKGIDGEPVTTITPTDGTVNVMVKNQTNAAIDYQAIGYTENQTLEGGETHTMRELPVPVVIRAARQDDGFVTTESMVNEDGVLEITLDEADERNVGVVKIKENGSVYINPDNSANAQMSEENMSTK